MNFVNKVRESKKRGFLKGSLHITIPPAIIDAYDIKKDDLVLLDLVKVIKK